jgi:hypothetical protein
VNWTAKNKNTPLVREMRSLHCSQSNDALNRFPIETAEDHEPHLWYEKHRTTIEMSGSTVTRTQMITWFTCPGIVPNE